MTKDIMIENAIISHVKLGCEDHGMLTLSIGLDMGGSGCVFGGVSLDGRIDKEDKLWMDGTQREPSAYCGAVIQRILKVVGKYNLDDLKGSPIRVKIEGGGFGQVVAIGNFLKDEWFSYRDMYYEVKKYLWASGWKVTYYGAAIPSNKGDSYSMIIPDFLNFNDCNDTVENLLKTTKEGLKAHIICLIEDDESLPMPSEEDEIIEKVRVYYETLGIGKLPNTTRVFPISVRIL